MATVQRRYLSCAETAQLMRKALKARFPDVQFSIRSKTYSGGASISVSYTDGPKPADVRAITDLYTGANFDASEDLKSYHDSMILTAQGIENVHFGADYVFVSRYYAPDTYETMLARVMRAMEVDDPRRYGFPSLVTREGLGDFELYGGDADAHGWAHRFLYQIALPSRKPSKDDKGGGIV